MPACEDPASPARLIGTCNLSSTGDDRRSGKQEYHPTEKGKDLIPLLLGIMTWSAKHDPRVAVPGVLIDELGKDRASVARAVRDLGSVEAFVASL